MFMKVYWSPSANQVVKLKSDRIKLAGSQSFFVFPNKIFLVSVKSKT